MKKQIFSQESHQTIIIHTAIMDSILVASFSLTVSTSHVLTMSFLEAYNTRENGGVGCISSTRASSTMQYMRNVRDVTLAGTHKVDIDIVLK